MVIVDIHTLEHPISADEISRKYLKDDSLDLSLRYESDYKSTKVVRDFVSAICDVFGGCDEWKSRLILMADELNNNAIEYGSLA